MFIGRTSLWQVLLLVVFSETITEQCIPYEWCNLIWDLNFKCCSEVIKNAAIIPKFDTSTTQNNIAKRTTTTTPTIPKTTSLSQINNSYTITSEFSCGRQMLDNNKIVGGSETKLGEFPWMAVVFYAKYNRSECAGSVIQRNFILTAAHCLHGQILYAMGKPYKVRLGEHDLTTDPDCLLDTDFCAPNAVEIQILNTFPHPKYQTNSRSSYDIGLIKLIDEIVYTDYIQPICFDLDIGSDITGQLLFVAGWGKTETAQQSNRKLKAAISAVNSNKCRQVYNDRNVKDDHICAGGNEGIDTCRGDSGAPLMLFKINIWYAIGVVSMGHSVCGKANHPALYTRTDMHIKWMRRKMLSS